MMPSQCLDIATSVIDVVVVVDMLSPFIFQFLQLGSGTLPVWQLSGTRSHLPEIIVLFIMGHSVIHLESHLQPAGIHAASDGDVCGCAGGKWQDELDHWQSKESAPQRHNIREQFARVLEKQPEGCPLVADTGQAQDPGHGASQGRIPGDHWCTRPGIDF